ncbi:DLW-39 family protein [Kocuria sp. CPCC 205268]
MNRKMAAVLALVGASVAVLTKVREADADRSAWADATDEVE